MIDSAQDQRRTVLITGCSAGGIGSALAEAFAERGLHVFATARSLSKMTNLKAQSNITLLELDVTSVASVNAAVETVRAATGGKLDYLVNNAGQSCVRPALDTSLEHARQVFEVNYWGMVHAVNGFGPLVIASSGMIVNVSSIAAVLYVPWGAYYNASKAAVRSYSESLRLEMAPLGVKVLTVMTGIVQTNIFANHPDPKLPEGSLWEPASKEITKNADGSLGEGTMTPSAFASRVVDDVLRGSTGLTWRGKMASIGWALGQFLPQWLLDLALTAGTGLEHIKKPSLLALSNAPYRLLNYQL